MNKNDIIKVQYKQLFEVENVLLRTYKRSIEMLDRAHQPNNNELRAMET